AGPPATTARRSSAVTSSRVSCRSWTPRTERRRPPVPTRRPLAGRRAPRGDARVGCARVQLLVVALAAIACGRTTSALTVAVALLPSELPVSRAGVADFERARGERVVVVPQQYADIRRALEAESAAGRGTLDLVELDVYSLEAAAPFVAPLDPAELDD